MVRTVSDRCPSRHLGFTGIGRVTSVMSRRDQRGLVGTAARAWRVGVPPDSVGVGVLRMAAWQAGCAGPEGRLLHPLTMRPEPAYATPWNRVDVHDTGVLHGVSAGRLSRDLIGHRFNAPEGHGKWLLARADGPTVLLHFGMTGELVFCPEADPPDPHDRVVFTTDRRHREGSSVWDDIGAPSSCTGLRRRGLSGDRTRPDRQSTPAPLPASVQEKLLPTLRELWSYRGNSESSDWVRRAVGRQTLMTSSPDSCEMPARPGPCHDRCTP